MDLFDSSDAFLLSQSTINALASSPHVHIGVVEGSSFRPAVPTGASTAPVGPNPLRPWRMDRELTAFARTRLFVRTEALDAVVRFLDGTFGSGSAVVGQSSAPDDVRNDRLATLLPEVGLSSAQVFEALGWFVVDISAIADRDENVVWRTIQEFAPRDSSGPSVRPVRVAFLAGYDDCTPAGCPMVENQAPIPLNLGTRGQGATVLVLDSGIEPTTAARLGGNVVQNDLANGWDIEQTYADAARTVLRSLAGHGTFVASVVHRFAPGAHVRVADVTDGQLNGVGAYAIFEDELASSLLFGLAQCPAGGVVVNLSLAVFDPGLGSSMFADTILWTKNVGPVPAFPADTDVSKLTRGNQVVYLAAAGNRPGQNAKDSFPAGIDWMRGPALAAPATPRAVINVGALSDDGMQPAPFSCTQEVDVWAIGEDVVGPYPEGDYDFPPGSGRAGSQHFPVDAWARWSGTSFATPRIAAEVARRIGSGATAQAALDAVLGGARVVLGRKVVP